MVHARTTIASAPPGSLTGGRELGGDFVAGFLAGVRAQIYRHALTRALLLGIAALSAIALALPVTAHVAGDSRFGNALMLAIGGLSAALVVIVAVGNGFIAPRRRFAADSALARWVGKRVPAAASDLLSAVELGRSPTEAWSPSQALVTAHHNATASRLETIAPRSLLSHRSIQRARTWALASIAVNAALLIAAPRVVMSGWSRVVHRPTSPFDGAALSDVPLVGDLEVTLTAPAYANRSPVTLAAISGDLRGLPGTKVAFRGRVLAPATTVELVIEGAGSSPGATTKVIAATIDRAGHMTAELTIDRSARYRFMTTSPAGRVVEAMPRSIDAEIDLAPNVELTAPDDPLEIANVKTIEVGYSIDDDFAVASAELVWEVGTGTGSQGDHGRKPLSLRSAGAETPRAQGKLMWDLAEINIAAGGEVRYWIEAKDNDAVTGPKLGRSRVAHLRVVSTRARHEQTLVRQERVAEKLLANLGARLSGSGDDVATRDELSRQLRDAITELRAVAAAFENDPHASELMRKALTAMGERIERVAVIEQRLLQTTNATAKDAAHAASRGRKPFVASDGKIVAELEDGALSLADWLDRERVESLLDIGDEISARHKRLANLLTQLSRTKEPRLAGEIERETRALERAYGELAKRRNSMSEDVLDQYIHRDAVRTEPGTSCVADVAALVRANKPAAAQAKLEACQQQQRRSASSLESALARVRDDKFGDEQNKLDEVMNALADVANDQDAVAADSRRLYDSYANRVNELAREHRRDAGTKLAALVDRVQKRIDAIDEVGLTPFAKEELDIMVRRIADVGHMVNDGDLAESLTMARQAKASLDAVVGELGAALDDDPKSKWVDTTQQALEGIEKTRPIVRELIEDLAAMSPRPEQILSVDDHRALERLRRRQGSNEQRAKRLGDRIKQYGGELPGDAARDLGKKLDSATDHMTKASDRMKAKDPSGARASTRAAADELAKARDKARSAARQAQQTAIDDEPVRIPGAEDHRTSERFREDLLEAMKHKSATAPEGYDRLIKRYYQDLAK